MKNLIFLISFVCVSLSTYAQKCKYEMNEAGDSLNARTIITKPILLFENPEVKGNITYKVEFGVKVIESDTLIRLRISRNDDRNPFEPENNTITIGLSNKKKITLQAKGSTECLSFVNEKGVTTIYDMDYMINNLMIEDFKKNKFVSLSISWEPGIQDEIKVNSAKQSIIKEQIRCL